MCVRHLDGEAVLTAASPPRGQHQANRPATCLWGSAASSGHCSCQPRLHCSTASAPSARSAAGVGGAYHGHDCHITSHAYAYHWQTRSHASAVAVHEFHPVFCTPALTECRSLYFNQLAGTLPAEWSALTSLKSTWVPCALLIRPCHLAVSAAWHVRQASGR
jgi:hypothetical protein